MDTTTKPILDEIAVTCTEGISKKKNKIITIKITAPKEAFILAEALSRFGKVQTIEEYFINGSRSLISDYITKTEKILSSAPAQFTNLKSN